MNQTSKQTVSAILGLQAQSAIHAGTGQQTGIIDLPIQREGHNGWPCIFGSAVKGALRTHAEQQKLAQLRARNEIVSDKGDYLKKVQESPEIAVIYGPPTSNASAHASAIMVTDARLLLFPVRSLTSQFKWVTCPEALKRYLQDSRRFGVNGISRSVSELIGEPPAQEQAVIHQDAQDQQLFLEEYRFTVTRHDLTPLIDALMPLMSAGSDDQELRISLQKQLVIIDDDSFAHIVNHATSVNAHIAIDSQTKTVKPGALWYEESLPPETLLYVGIGANDGRRASEKDDLGSLPENARSILNTVLGLFADRPWLQLGGNETVGMGWCAVSAVEQEG